MEAFQALMAGFGIALRPEYLTFAFLGSFVGTMIGVMPGIGTAAATAMLIPLTFQLDPTGAIIMLAAIYYGSMYGGTVTGVLLNIPGESSSVATLFDGYPMARNGRGGVALSMAAVGSFIGATISMFGLVFVALPLARMALRFGPPETLALMVLGLSLVMALSGKSVIKGLMMGVSGLLLATVGMDPTEGVARLTFGRMELLGGLEFVPVVMGVFGIGEVLLAAESRSKPVLETKMSSLIPTVRDVKDSAWPVVRASALGFFLGLIPGISSTLGTFMSYIFERKMSKYPEKFGTGVIEGVVGPETENNAHVTSNFIPLFTLGIPGTATMAVLLGAFTMNGLIPGPQLFRDHADFVWAVIASMYVGNAMCLVLNLPLIGLWVSILRIPSSILFSLILAITLVGSYSVNGSVFDVATMILFGVVGYVLRKLDFPLAPLILTLILGPLMERALRASLQMSQGDITILFATPISATLLALAVFFLVTSGLSALPIGPSIVRTDAD